MCGLVGVFGMLTNSHEKAFRDMLLMDVVRGDDSTGVASVGYDQAITIIKEIGPPNNILYDVEFINLAKRYNRMLMGHNRFATIGKVTKENAHPFVEEHIVGAHNGTINQDPLPDNDYFASDSANLIYAISLEGIEETWKKLDGAAAVTYWDTERKELNLIRNTQRPLCYSYNDDKTAILWASESWMIKGAAERNHLKLDKDIFIICPHFLHTFKLKDGTIDHVFKELEFFKPPPAPPKKHFVPNNSQGSWRKEVAKEIEQCAEKIKVLREENTTASNRKARKIERKLRKQAARLKNNNEAEAMQLALEKKALETKNNRMEKEPKLTRAEFDEKFDKCVFCDDWLVYEDENVQISYDIMSCRLCAQTATEFDMIN